ncbi:MAG: hypothetical protein V5A88_02435 [Candidatus Thermoplasmatota archaeon]
MFEFDKKAVLIVSVIGTLSIVTIIFLGAEGMIFVVFWFVVPVLIKKMIEYLRKKLPL